MSEEHPNKILVHEPTEPYPKIFKTVFWVLCFYLALIFIVTGSHFVIGGGH